MRVMVIVEATKESEAGVMPSPELMAEMGAFNQALIDAGVFVDAGGLKASSKGARVAFAGKDRTVKKGPFPNTGELAAGYWIWKVDSRDEAIDWVKRCPIRCPALPRSRSANFSRWRTSADRRLATTTRPTGRDSGGRTVFAHCRHQPV